MKRTCLAIYTLTAALFVGSEIAGRAQGTEPEPETARREAELGAFLDRWVAAFGAADPDEIRAVCSSAPEFAWYEDGELRYPSVDRILAALAALPDGMRFETTYSDVRTRFLREDVATVGARFVSDAHGPFELHLEGAVTFVAAREDGDWRIVLGHTSTRRDGR